MSTNYTIQTIQHTEWFHAFTLASMVSFCVYVRTYVCMYGMVWYGMVVCLFVCSLIFVCLPVCLIVYLLGLLYVCEYVGFNVCMRLWLHACVFAGMQVCMYACMICCFSLSHDFFQTTTCQCVLCKVIHSHMDGDVIKVPITALMCLGGNPKVGCSWLNNVTMLSIRCALFLSSGTAFQMTDCQFWKIGSRSLKGCCFQGWSCPESRSMWQQGS